MTNASQLPKALVFTALRVEYLAVQKGLVDLEEKSHKTSIYEHGTYRGRNQDWDVWIVETGRGNTRASAEVERGLQFVEPALTFFVGVAGGIKDVRLGDVVVATKVYAYQNGKVAKSFEPRPEVFQASDLLLNRARAEARTNEWFASPNQTESLPNVFTEPIAAGEQVIASTRSDTFQFIRRNYGDAVAVDMEGYGHLLAAHANETPAMVVRGISDLLDNKARADKSGSQGRAAANASAFMFSVLGKISSATLKTARDADFTINWETTHLLLNKLQRDIETAFAPDIVVTMSGPGSFAACYCMALNSRDIPVLFATTFPKRAQRNASYENFRKVAVDADWIYLETNKWEVYLPNLLAQLPPKSKVLIFDDRVITGETQMKLKSVLQNYDYEVRCAAMLAGSEVAAQLDFIGQARDGDYYMPWGSKHGRS